MSRFSDISRQPMQTTTSERVRTRRTALAAYMTSTSKPHASYLLEKSEPSDGRPVAPGQTHGTEHGKLCDAASHQEYALTPFLGGAVRCGKHCILPKELVLIRPPTSSKNQSFAARVQRVPKTVPGPGFAGLYLGCQVPQDPTLCPWEPHRCPHFPCFLY